MIRCPGYRSKLICPKLASNPWLSGFENCTWLKVLKNSVRNSKYLLSVTRMCLLSEISQLLIPGPRSEFRPSVPYVNSGTPTSPPEHVGSSFGQGVHTRFVGSNQKFPSVGFPCPSAQSLENPPFAAFGFGFRGFTRRTGPTTSGRSRKLFCPLAFPLE